MWNLEVAKSEKYEKMHSIKIDGIASNPSFMVECFSVRATSRNLI